MVDSNLANRSWTEAYPLTFYTTLMMLMGDSVDVASAPEFLIASLIVIMGITLNAIMCTRPAPYHALHPAPPTLCLPSASKPRAV